MSRTQSGAERHNVRPRNDDEESHPVSLACDPFDRRPASPCSERLRGLAGEPDTRTGWTRWRRLCRLLPSHTSARTPRPQTEIIRQTLSPVAGVSAPVIWAELDCV